MSKTALPRKRGAKAKPPGAGQYKRKRAVTAQLTPMQSAFIERWMLRRNATRAYMDSHPSASYVTALSQGSALFHDPRISTEIKRLIADESKRLKPTADRVIRELSALAFSSVSDATDENGALVPPSRLPRDVAIAVKKVKRKEMVATDPETGERRVVGHEVEFEMHDKVQPLKLLGDHFELFKERVVHSVDDDLLKVLKEARERSLAQTGG